MSKYSYLELLSYDPFRLPDWKWSVASQLHENDDDPNGFYWSLFADPAIHGALEYFKSDPEEKEANPIHAALRLHEQDDPLTWEIEARILADQSDEEIANRTNQPVDVITWFAALFFAVRDTLQAGDYITNQVLNGKPLDGFGDDNVREYWGMLAYESGLIALDVAIQNYKLAKPKSGAFRLSHYFDRDSRVPLDFQSLVATLLLPYDSRTSDFYASLNEFSGLSSREEDAAALTRLRKRILKAARLYLAGKPIPVPKAKKESPSRERVALELAKVNLADLKKQTGSKGHR